MVSAQPAGFYFSHHCKAQSRLRESYCSLQGISEEISRLESQQKGNDEMKRQIDEVISYQQSRSLEKELQLKIEQVNLLPRPYELIGAYTQGC